MKEELQTYNNDLHVREIKLDKTIQKFLERQNYEQYDIQKVDIETNEDIDFIKISHISYDRSKSLLCQSSSFDTHTTKLKQHKN